MPTIETPGICIRTAECQVARLGRGVKIPLGAPFVCPGCGHALAPPAQPGVLASRRASMNAVPLAIFASAGLLVLSGSVLLGWQLGAGGAAHAAPAHTALAAAKSSGKIAALDSATAKPPPSPIQTAVLTQPIIPPAPVARPDAGAPQPPRHTDAAPAAAPLPLAQPATIQRAVARMPAPAAAAPEPTGQDRPFSTRTLVGGTPAFPASYDPRRSGRVTVSCMIGTDGSPSGCVTLWEQGGRAFATSVQSWLNAGQVRFQPALKQGRAEARRESWTVVFN